MDSLNDIVMRETDAYAGESWNNYAYFGVFPEDNAYMVVDVSRQPTGRLIDVGLLVRVAGDKVIIEHDLNNKPLVDALVQAGVPRERIVLVYAGEMLEQNDSP